MENLRPSTDFSVNANANFVSNALSQTTMVDHNRLVNVNATCKLTGVPVSASLDGSKMDKPEMTDNEESVAQRLEASLSQMDASARAARLSLAAVVLAGDERPSPDSKQKIESLLADIRKLDDKQKLLLYLQLPSGSPEQDVSSKSSCPMLSSCRVDQMTAVNWVRSHIEESPDTSLPKQEVYEEYRSFCENSYHRPLSTADFGKIIKSVFPAVQARRLGTRGNSRYCYSGMRKKLELTSPSLPPLDAPMAKLGVECLQTTCPGCPKSLLQGEDDHLQKAASQVICEWASGIANKTFANSLQLAQHLTNNKLVNKSSKSILIVQKHMGEVPRPDLTPEMRHRETNYHLKQTLQYRQEIRKKQAEENQQRLHLSPVSSRQPTTEDSLSSHVTRTDKATQLEQRDVPALSDGSVGNSLTLPESGESSTNPENHLSSSNASGGDGANVASKESPSKRRFAPIQPKTPVRDTGAPVVLISPSAKNVNGQSMQLVVMNGQKVIPVQGISKLTSPQQMNVILGQNVFQSPVPTAAVGNQTQVNVVSSPVVGNTVLSSPVIPANSIQNAIKSGHYVLVGNTVKPRSGLQPVTNTNAAIRQNQGQPVATNQVAVVAQAAPPQPHVVVSTSSVACQKTGLSSQGITYNTGTSNVRSQNVTPVFFDGTAPTSAPTLTSPVNVMAQALSSQASKLVSPANILVRNATSALVPIPLSQSIATSNSSVLKTSVTFATQPMKVNSSVDVIGSDAFQGNHVLSNASQSSVDPNKIATSQLTLINCSKLEKGTPVGRPVKNSNPVQSDLGRSVAGSSKASIMQNSGSKTVATLLKDAQAISSLASSSGTLPKLSTPSTAVVDPSTNLVLAQVQNLPRQHDGSKVQHYVIQAATEDAGNSVLSSERSALTSAVGNIGPVIVNSQELSSLQQGSMLTSILTDQPNTQQQANKGGLTLQTIPVEDANVLNQLVTQPSVSLLADADHSNNTMLMVSGMSAATMLPHRSKSLDTQLINQLPHTQTTVAIRTSQPQQTDVTVSVPLKQVTKMQQLTQIPTSSQPRMLERLLASENLSYISNPVQSEMRSARSVPTTPIAELQSPPPHMMMRAQSAAIPVQQGGDSVPPSPVDGKSFAFTPINTIEFEGGESPLKPKCKPKATHPTVRSALTQALTNSDVQDSQNGNVLAKNKGKRSQPPEFLTPNRKRRLSSNSKRVAAASPSAVHFQNQNQNHNQVHQNVTSPALNQLTKQQPRFYIQTNQQGVTQGSAVGTGNLHISSQFLGGGLQNQQATLLRRRNPSGPACSNVNMQVTGDSETELLHLLNNVDPNLQAMLDKKALQNRSQSVPLPEQHSNRFSRLQLPTQPEVLINQNSLVSNQITSSQMQIIPVQLEDQGRQIQPTNGFTAKRNLTQDLLNLEVTEEDFAPETLLNTEISTGSDLQPSHSLGETNWSSAQVETSVATDTNVHSQLAEFNMKYDEIADQQNGNSSHLAASQTLLPNQAFNDTSNSTASSMSDNMMIEEFPDKMFQDIEDQGFDLPPTPWQMGTSSTSLSTLECGM